MQMVLVQDRKVQTSLRCGSLLSTTLPSGERGCGEREGSGYNFGPFCLVRFSLHMHESIIGSLTRQ